VGPARKLPTKLAAAGRRPRQMDGLPKGHQGPCLGRSPTRYGARAGVAFDRLCIAAQKFRALRPDGARFRGDILSRKVGTCLEFSRLLYASCLEQAGLNPVLALTEGHSFVGIWLVGPRTFPSLVIDDPQMLRKARAARGKMVVVETTLSKTGIASGSVQTGGRGRQEADRRGLRPRHSKIAIDVRRARGRENPPARSLWFDRSCDPARDPPPRPPQEVGEVPPIWKKRLDKRREPTPEEEPRSASNKIGKKRRPSRSQSEETGCSTSKTRNRPIAIECPDPAAIGGQAFRRRPFSNFSAKTTVLDGKRRP